MSSRCRPTIAIAVALVAGAASARAQAPGGEQTIAEADFRVGGLWPLPDANTAPTVGGRFALFFWTPGDAARLSVQIIGDYRRLSQTTGADPELSFDTQVTRHLWLVGPSLGWDVVRQPRFEIDVRGGGALVGERTTLAFDPGGKDAQDVCRYFEFNDRCSSDYGFAGTLGAGLRILVTDRIYVGLDYSRVFREDGQNLLVGSFGFRIWE